MSDIAAIEKITTDFCPDRHQEVTSFRHGDDWAVIEWTGYGSFAGLPDGRARGLPLTQKGMTLVPWTACIRRRWVRASRSRAEARA